MGIIGIKVSITAEGNATAEHQCVDVCEEMRLQHVDTRRVVCNKTTARPYRLCWLKSQIARLDLLG